MKRVLKPSELVPTKSSPIEYWVEFHKSLVDYFGKKDANTLFITAWNKLGRKSIVTEKAKDYFKSQGLDIKGDLTTEVLDIAKTPFDALSGAFGVGKNILYIGLGLGAVAVILISVGVMKGLSKSSVNLNK